MGLSNNYIIETVEGKRKLKGAYVSDIQLDKGYDMPVVSKVAEKVLFDNADIYEELRNHGNIYDFCKAQKVGGQFTVEYHSIKDAKHQIDQMQKTNRYYVSTNGNKLFKNKSGKLHDLCAGFRVSIFNDYVESDSYDINYGYYASEVNKLLAPFDNSQLSLF